MTLLAPRKLVPRCASSSPSACGGWGEARSRIGPVIAQARAARNPVVLRQALAAAGYFAALAGDPGAGDQLREAVRLPGFTDMPFPYDAPETVLGAWHLWRGELDPARDLLKAVIDVAERQGSTGKRRHHPSISRSWSGARATGMPRPRTPPPLPAGGARAATARKEYRPTWSRSSRRAAATSNAPANWPPPE